MPNRLYLLRHAEAADSVPDETRPLTPEGIRDMKAGAKALAQAAPDVQRILTSPLLRARQTAEIAGKALGLKPELWESLRPGRKPVLPKEIALLVGHAPGLDQVAQELTGARIALRKGGACCLEGDLLDWLLTPRQLRLLARRKGG